MSTTLCCAGSDCDANPSSVFDVMEPHVPADLQKLFCQIKKAALAPKRAVSVPLHVPTDDELKHYREALQRSGAGEEKGAKAPRVYLFSIDDKCSSQSARVRRRKVAYVWLEGTGTNRGVVFYGGSVYNPNLTLKHLLQNSKFLQACNVEDALKEVQTMVETSRTKAKTTPYVRRKETQTALSRLALCPIVFQTTAQSHEEVRKQVEYYVFNVGVAAKRAKKTQAAAV